MAGTIFNQYSDVLVCLKNEKHIEVLQRLSRTSKGMCELTREILPGLKTMALMTDSVIDKKHEMKVLYSNDLFISGTEKISSDIFSCFSGQRAYRFLIFSENTSASTQWKQYLRVAVAAPLWLGGYMITPSKVTNTISSFFGFPLSGCFEAMATATTGIATMGFLVNKVSNFILGWNRSQQAKLGDDLHKLTDSARSSLLS